MQPMPMLPKGVPLFVKLGRRQAWCWLAGDRRDCTVFYPKGNAYSFNPGISDALDTDPLETETERMLRACIVQQKGPQWQYAKIARVRLTRSTLYPFLRLNGCDTSNRNPFVVMYPVASRKPREPSRDVLPHHDEQGEPEARPASADLLEAFGADDED